MNKQRYLAELQRLLVFMTEEDREKTVHRYGEMFDAAGEAGEPELLSKLGSPTKAAIQLSRGYEPGQVDAVLPHVDAVLPQTEPPAAPEPESAAPVFQAEDLWDELPSFELPDLDAEPPLPTNESAEEITEPAEPAPDPDPAQGPQVTEPVESAETAGTPESMEMAAPAEPVDTVKEEAAAPIIEGSDEPPVEKAAAEAEAAPTADSAVATAPAPRPELSEEPWRTKNVKKKAPAAATSRSLPLGVGIPLFFLVMVALGVPLAVLCLGVMAALLIPGGVGLVGAYLVAVGGLWCLGYMADAILMFGLAFLILALALVILWLGLWIDVKLANLYVQGVSWLSDELLGKQVTEDE